MSDRLPPLTWDAGELPARRAEPLGEGEFTTCLLLDRTHVLRIARHAEASASIAREIELLPRLADRFEVEIPRVVGHGRHADTGARFVAYPLVPGTPLAPEVLAALDPGRRAGFVEQMARFALDLHRVPLGVAESAGLARIDPRHELPALVAAARARVAPRLEPAAWAYHERLLERWLDDPVLHATRTALLHGDLSPWHFLADLERGRITGVIDFGDAFVGDPHRDLIFLLEDCGADVLDLFLRTYAPADRRAAAERVRIHQELDNVGYCLSRLEAGDEPAIEEALRTLARQAARGR